MSTFLGLALGERSILAAEVHISGARRQVRRSGEFVFPVELSWNRPQALGEALRQFLRHHRFSASRAVAGVPARWIMAREREVPPSSSDMGISALRLQAERLFPPELKELVFDFAGEIDSKQPRRVLLTAIPKQRLDQIMTVADSAGLSLLAVTSSTLALASAAGRENGSDLMLSVGTDAAEFAATAEGSPHLLKHLSFSAAAPVPEGSGSTMGRMESARTAQMSGAATQLGTELRRIVSVMPLNGHTRDLLLWDGVGLTDSESDTIAGRIGLAVTKGDALRALGVEGENSLMMRFGPAVALGIAGAVAAGKARRSERLGALPVDFLNARLAPPKVRRVGRREVWIGVVTIALVGLFGFLVYDVKSLESRVAEIQTGRQSLSPDAQAAQAIKDRIQLTHGWFMEGRPKTLECLRELAQAFPETDPIWVTTFSVQEFRDQVKEGTKMVPRVRWKCTLQGKASSLDPALVLRSRLANNQAFADVTLNRSSGGLAAGAARSPFSPGGSGTSSSSGSGSNGSSSSSSSGSTSSGSSSSSDRERSDRERSDRGSSRSGSREPEVSFILTFFFNAM